MTSRLIHSILTLLSATSLLMACGDFFDKTGDDDLLAADRLFADDAAYRTAMTDVYIQLRSPHLYGGTLTLTLLEEAAQTLMPYDPATIAAARHDFADPAVSERIDSMVLRAYTVVAACNQVISQAADVSRRSSEVRMAVGEAYGLRAAVQFDLLRLFHPLPSADGQFRGLPYMTQTGAADTPAMTTHELLQHIEADLLTASALLHDADPLRSATNSTVSVGQTDRRLRTMQLNWYAVKALQARVALWQGHHEEVLAAADSVMQHLQDVNSRNQVFYFVQPGKYGSDFCFSREFVFGIATTPDGFATLSDHLFVSLGVKTTDRLHNIYSDAADIRYRAWFRQSPDGEGYTMQRKFGSETLLTGYVVSATGSEMQLPVSIPYIKLGEVTLMAAEALLAEGRVEEALQRIEELEQQKGAELYAVPLRSEGQADAQSVRQLLMDEYERELFGEGQLFYVYKRLKGDASLTLPLPKNL